MHQRYGQNFSDKYRQTTFAAKNGGCDNEIGDSETEMVNFICFFNSSRPVTDTHFHEKVYRDRDLMFRFFRMPERSK
jgi:hypothetical protein